MIKFLDDQKPSNRILYIPKTSHLRAVDKILFSREIVMQFLIDSLVPAHDRMKKYAELF